MLNRSCLTIALGLLASLSLPATAFAAPVSWFPFGPDGGDARAFAQDPKDHTHLFLGSITGWIYESHDGGQNWKHLSQIANRDDLALDNIVVDPADPKHIIVGAWVLGRADGGLFVSNDGGTTWTANAAMKGESIRALTAAPSDPKIITAGTLQGVFRSTDNGANWKLVSPANSKEIHEVESIAIDPVDPQTIYAGTWHLPWKSTDGGVTWTNMKQGIIDDSDVFSIIVDPKQPKVIYASACSGIYKSETGGQQFAKIQGIPTTARRTRVLMQDPVNLTTVFAGTTEGLFRSNDSGKVWTRTTGPDVIVNDVYVDPSDAKHVILATDRSGVLTSNDGGNSFRPTNTGFSSRQITSFVADSRHPAESYVGVVNDKQFGGVFQSKDGGLSWAQIASGLDKHDVFSLNQAADGTLLAGTEHGLYLLDSEKQVWSRGGMIAPPPTAEEPVKKPVRSAKGRTVVAPRKPVKKEEPTPIQSGITTIARIGDQLYVLSTEGVFASEAGDPHKEWTRIVTPSADDWRYLSSQQSVALMASFKSLALSQDGGKNWHGVSAPAEIKQISSVAVDDTGGLWVAGGEGIFTSADQGATWASPKNLFVTHVNNIYYDPAGQRLLVAANASSTLAYSYHLPDKTLKYWTTGWNLRFIRPVGDHLVAATLFDGIVVEPRMVESKEVAGK